MRYLMILPSVLALVLVGSVAAPAQADECNELTYMTFGAPVSLPGVTLPAGTYRFTRPECGMTGLLRVSSRNGSEVYGTFLTASEDRPTPTSRVEVVFAKMPASSADAIKAWFYPGETTGDELIYPKNEAAKVAEAPVQTVFATNGLAW